jgi:hypothetical protein
MSCVISRHVICFHLVPSLNLWLPRFCFSTENRQLAGVTSGQYAKCSRNSHCRWCKTCQDAMARCRRALTFRSRKLDRRNSGCLQSVASSDWSRVGQHAVALIVVLVYMKSGCNTHLWSQNNYQSACRLHSPEVFVCWDPQYFHSMLACSVSGVWP